MRWSSHRKSHLEKVLGEIPNKLREINELARAFVWAFGKECACGCYIACGNCYLHWPGTGAFDVSDLDNLESRKGVRFIYLRLFFVVNEPDPFLLDPFLLKC